MILVACNSGQGVDVEVHSEKSLTAVELWLGYDDCHLRDGVTNCEGIAWPGASGITTGKVLTLGEDEKVFRTEVIVGGVAQLHLEASAADSRPISIAVVGFSGTDVVSAELLKHVEIPVNDQVHWRVDLDAASPKATSDIMSNPAAAPTHNALVWARKPSSTVPDTTGYSGCLAYQEWNGVAWETTYFVPNSDTDCDGEPPDCNPYWYDAPISSARCVTNPQIASNVCAVGSLSCRSETQDVTCSEQLPPTGPLTCVGSAICEACKDTTDLATCLKAQIPTSTTSSPPVPLLRCPMQGDPDSPCINNSTTQNWSARFVIKGGTCAPATNGETAVLRPVIMPFSGGTTSMMLSNATTVSVHASGVAGSGCQIDLTYATGGITQSSTQPIMLAVNYGPGRQIVIPVLLDFGLPNGSVCPTASNTPASCTPLGNWPDTGPGDSQFMCTMLP